MIGWENELFLLPGTNVYEFNNIIQSNIQSEAVHTSLLML